MKNAKKRFWHIVKLDLEYKIICGIIFRNKVAQEGDGMESAMKKLFGKKVVPVLLLLITVVWSVYYGYMTLRPISYGMEYEFHDTFDGIEFDSVSVFHRDNTITFQNSNFDEVQESYYYYKDGYLFNCLAEDEQAFLEEVEQINANWEASLAKLFYSSQINAFTLTNGADDYILVQECSAAKTFAIAGGIAELCLIALTVFAFICNRKQNQETK